MGNKEDLEGPGGIQPTEQQAVPAMKQNQQQIPAGGVPITTHGIFMKT